MYIIKVNLGEPKFIEKSILTSILINTFAQNLEPMNLQSFLTPIAEFLVWIFDSLLVPISDAFNWVVIIIAIVGIFGWLRMLKSYNVKAEQEGTIM